MINKRLFDYNIFFDYRKLGWGIYHCLFKVKNTERIDIDKLKDVNDVTYINTFLGKYDLHVIILAKNNKSKKEKINEIKNILINDNIIDIDICKYKFELKLTHILPEFDLNVPKPKSIKNKIYSLNKESFMAKEYTTKLNLDKKDIKIIKSLIYNPQATYLEISTITNTSRDTIKKRITNYINNNFLVHFGIFPNLKKFGYFTYCIYAKLESIDINSIRNFVLHNNFIFYTEICEGKKNIFIYIWTKTPEEFSNYFKETKKYLSNNLIDIDLLIFDNLILQMEFPSSILK
jgi:DNA-binding Lrp family transcriptional regulator